jgi:hypothetical protein
MFLLYEYLESIIEAVPEVKVVERVSSIIQLEEMLTNIRENPRCRLLIKDSGDGHLDFKDHRLNTAYHIFYIFLKANVNDHSSRMNAKREAMSIGIKLIDRMRADSEDFGMQTYGFDDSRVDYGEIGPIGNNYYGYSFGFTIKQGFSKL